MTYGCVAFGDGQLAGPGAVTARRLPRDGFAVAVNGRPGDDQVAALGRAIRDDDGAAEGFCADVTDEDQVAYRALRAGLRVNDLQALHAEQHRRRILDHDARGFLMIMNLW